MARCDHEPAAALAEVDAVAFCARKQAECVTQDRSLIAMRPAVLLAANLLIAPSVCRPQLLEARAQADQLGAVGIGVEET